VSCLLTFPPCRAGLLLLTLMIPNLAQAQDTESSAQTSVDTEHIFGFTEGADIGEKGEKELENAMTGRFGKLGHYTGLTNETAFFYGVAEGFRASIGALANYHAVTGVPNLADRHGLNFSGVTSEFRWQILERGSSPFDLTLSFAPRWQRIDDTSGERVQSYVLPFTLLADMALIPDKTFAAFNLTYAPAFTRTDGTWRQESPVEISLAVATAIIDNVFLGAEVRHLTLNQNSFFSEHALFVGPSLFVKLSDPLSVKVAWDAQIPDETTGRIDLANYERQQVRAQL
jgi:hypothetical protein